MSGGYFNFEDSNLKFEIFGFGKTCSNVFEDKEISQLIWDVFDLLHDYDWYRSGDTCKDTWLKKKRLFKKKWIRSSFEQERTKQIIDESIEDLRKELYETYLDGESIEDD